jgi:hypothetical protein
VKIWRTALSNRFHGVLPSTFGAGSGFMASILPLIVISLRLRFQQACLALGTGWGGPEGCR